MSDNFDIKKLVGDVKIQPDNSYSLVRDVEGIQVTYLLIDATSRSPESSNRFKPFRDTEVEVEGILQKRILYVRKIRKRRIV